MRIAITIARILVGVLFIFSGLVKANDPLGLSYKMQEFFEIWGMSRFDSWTLLSSIFMNAFEIIAGFAILLGWQTRLFSWLLLLLIVFFTFLTGYTFYTGKPANCGCFGDCLPISSKTSFLKDVALTLLIAFLFWQWKKIKPIFTGSVRTIVMVVVIAFSFLFQWYALTWLPVVDCLPFKKGKNIPAQMVAPPGSVPDSFAIRFVYTKDGKQFEFAPAELPADLANYTYVSRTDKLIRKGNAEPPIKAFALTTEDNTDVTGDIMQQGMVVLVFTLGLSEPHPGWTKSLAELKQTMDQVKAPTYFVSSDYTGTVAWSANNKLNINVLKCDVTAIRTAARTNPCVYLLKQGTIIAKSSYKDIDKLTNIVRNTH